MPPCHGFTNMRSRSGCPPDELREGVASLLDYLRRKRVLYDPEREIFTKYWMDGDLEVQQGYLPQVGNPIGTKLRRGADREGGACHAMAERTGRHHHPADGEEVGRGDQITPKCSLKGFPTSLSVNSC